MEASAEREGGFIDFSRISFGEIGGMLAAAVLAVSLFLPWFSTSSNPNSEINPAGTFACCGTGGIGPSDQATAWQTFPLLRWLLLLACIAPFILTWIVLRGHDLTWKPGEVTMIVGITAFVLILCNGVILGKPEPNIELSFSYGYLVALVSAIGMAVAGYIRQAFHTDEKKPPGVL